MAEEASIGRVQTLIKDYYKEWDLDKLLLGMRLNEKMNCYVDSLRDQSILKNPPFLQMLCYLERKKLWPSFCFMGLIQNRFVHKGVQYVLLTMHSHLKSVKVCLQCATIYSISCVPS